MIAELLVEHRVIFLSYRIPANTPLRQLTNLNPNLLISLTLLTLILNPTFHCYFANNTLFATGKKHAVNDVKF